MGGVLAKVFLRDHIHTDLLATPVDEAAVMSPSIIPIRARDGANASNLTPDDALGASRFKTGSLHFQCQG